MSAAEWDVRLLTIAWSVTAAATVISTLCLGAWMVRIARAIRRDERFPPNGTRLLAETQVLVGDAAVRRARILEGIGALTLIVGGAIAVVAWRLHEMFTVPR